MSLGVFRVSWPIVDQDTTISEAKAVARVEFEQKARDADVKLIGDIAWAVYGPQLVAVASAIPPAKTPRIYKRAPKSAVSGRADEILQLSGQGYSYTQIAEVMGCNKSSVAKILQRLRAKEPDECEAA